MSVINSTHESPVLLAGRGYVFVSLIEPGRTPVPLAGVEETREQRKLAAKQAKRKAGQGSVLAGLTTTRNSLEGLGRNQREEAPSYQRGSIAGVS